MKPFFLQIFIVTAFCLWFVFGASPLYGQATVGGTTSSASAELDIQSTTGGLLPPRMTTAQRDAIAMPAKGLLVFNTTLSCIEVNMGTPTVPAWACLVLPNTVSVPSATPSACRSETITPITHTTTGATGIGTATGLPVGLTASWASNTITIAGTISSTATARTYNYTIPLTGGVDGGQATGTITVRANNTASGLLSAGAVPLGRGRAVTLKTHRTTGATGIGTPTGLPAGLTASWAADTIVISGTPTAAGTFNYTVPLTGGCGSINATGSILVEPGDCGAFVATGVWKVFKCHNLGAVSSADPFTPNWQLNGSYYQWGKATVAASAPTDGTTTTGAVSGAVSGWSSTRAANGAWSDASKTANDPCPTGFRVPTISQWDSVSNIQLNPTQSIVGTWSSSTTNYNSGLRIGSGTSGLYLPAAGQRDDLSGALVNRGSRCFYWSSTSSGTGDARRLFLQSPQSIDVGGTAGRAAGYSVRCIAE